ncbi:MAG: DHH family phosphoesterase [Clostridia bacterium]
MDNKKFLGIFSPRVNLYLFIIFLLISIIAMDKWFIAIPLYIVLAFLIYFNYRTSHKRQKEITKYIENLTLNIDSATKDTLLNFPMPLVLIQLDGTIIWYNSSMRKIFAGKDMLEKTIGSLIKDLKFENIMEDSSETFKDIMINGRHYSILKNLIRLDEKKSVNEYILLLYFIDNTELIEIRKKYEDEKISVAVIIIDNYDELMQSVEDSNRPQMNAEIEKKVAQWISFTNGIIKKFERDRYIFVFETRYMKEFEDKKFEILDSIKEISIGNKIPVTLSIGFGQNGETISENFRYANAAIDIALGRGGDQVVVKDNTKFDFFGGRTREIEKRTRVKARVISQALRELIDQSREVLIMGHENGDIDCLGSSMGLYRIVKSRDKNAYIVLNNSNPTIDSLISKIQENPEYNGLFIGNSEAMDIINEKTLLIVVDTYRPNFTENPELLKYSNQIVVIDHHRKGADFIQDAVIAYQETYASSASELVTEMLQYVGDNIKLTPIEAESLYAGIVVDTKNFTFKTGVRTFEAASYLREQGVETVAVKQLFQNDLSTYISISDVVKNAEIIEDTIAISVCPKNMKNSQLIAAQAADQLLSLKGLMAAFVLSYSNNEVYISGRSLGDINVQVVLERLGGGGHISVAGAQLQGISVEDAKEKLKYAIIEYVKELNDTEKQ